ncbi:hypothetical protein PENSPDRAFT_686397 [Peniophora sp. CONT]|nr:hypothetical protein PENSPDRAFT_686397 [Peniophora sp. CONT]
MSGIGLETATLLALFLETLLYGIFSALCVVTVIQQHKVKNASEGRWTLPVSGMMLVIATTHLIIAFVRAHSGFTVAVHTPAGSQGFFANVSVPLHVAMDCLYVLQTTIGDAVLIWRLYMVYARNLWVACPFLVTLIANLVTGSIVCYFEATATPGSTIFLTASKWIEAFFILTMCTNSLCTAGIMWRIWSRGHKQGGLIWVLLIVAESGALYSTAVLSLFIAYVRNSEGQYVAIDLIVPLVGIIFVLIVLRRYFGMGHTSPSYCRPRPIRFSNLPQSRSHESSSFGCGQEGKMEHAPVHNLVVHVASNTEVGYPGMDGARRDSFVVEDETLDDTKPPRSMAESSCC